VSLRGRDRENWIECKNSSELVKVPVMQQVLQVGRVILELVWQTDNILERAHYLNRGVCSTGELIIGS